MSNNFAEDPNCVALWRFESGALTTDSKGTNTLTAVNTPTAETSDFKEGSACVTILDADNDNFNIDDADLDLGFPLKSTEQSYEDYTTEYDDGQFISAAGLYRCAQTFTAESDHFVTSVDLLLYRSSTLLIGTMYCGIFATSGGEPTGAALATGEVDFTYSSLTTTYPGAVVTFDLDTTLKLTSGTTYAIVLWMAGGSNVYGIYVVHMNSGSYAGGNMLTSSDSGSSWGSTSADIYFEILMQAISISLCFWAKPYTIPASDYGTILNKSGESDKRSFFAIIHSNGNFYLGIGKSGGSSVEWGQETTVVAVANQWYHVGITFDAVTRYWRIRVWDQTAGTVSETTGQMVNVIYTGAGPMCIGERTGAYDYGYDGLVDEMVVFNRILTADEIDEIRGASFGPVLYPPSAAQAISPPDTATSVSQSLASIQWWGDGDTYDVYFGTSEALVTAKDASVKVSTGQTALSYTLVSSLTYGQTYFWRVDSINDDGTTESDVWSFIVETETTPDSYAPWAPDMLVSYKEVLAFNTEILAAHDRTEQRIAKRSGIPRRSFQSTELISANDWTDWTMIASKWAKLMWPVPIWAECEHHVGTLASGSSQIDTSLDYNGYREGGYILIWKSRTQWEVLLIDSISTSDQIILDSTVQDTYSNGYWTAPVELGYISGSIQAQHIHGHSRVSATHVIRDLVDVSGFVADQTFDGMTVITDPTLLNSLSHDQDHAPDIAFIDYKTSPFVVVSNSDLNIVTHPYKWRFTTQARCWWFRQFLHNVKCNQKSFLVPTFENDLVLTEACSADHLTIHVQSAGLTANIGTDRLNNYLAFFRDGTLRVLKVQSIWEGVGEEIISLTTAVGGTYSAGTGICWVDKVRINENSVELNWISRQEMECETGLVRLP